MLVRHNEHSYLLILKCHLGTGDATKMDEFSEKFQTAFDLLPPPHFRKIMYKYPF